MNRAEKIDAVKRQKYFVPGDVAVFAAALLLIAACLLFALFPAADEAGTRFYICYDGEAVFSAPLNKDAAYLFTLEDGRPRVEAYAEGDALPEGYNLIRAEGGRVRVAEADCPDKTCIAFGARDRGEIVCWAHRMVIRIENEGLVTDV